jgi:hypothetical protein
MESATASMAVVLLAIGAAIMGATGCSWWDATAHSQAEVTHAQLAAARTDAAAANAQNAADQATVASLRAEKAARDANREITRVQHHLDQLAARNSHRRLRHHHKHHHAKTTTSS